MPLKNLSLVTAPTVEPVTLADALSFLRVDNAAESSLVSSLVATAREVVELYTGRAMLSQQWILTMQDWASGLPENFQSTFTTAIMISSGAIIPYPAARRDRFDVINLDISPLLTVDSVKYYDANEALQTFASSNYYVLTRQLPGAVALKALASWPVLFDRPDAVQITFTAGHGTTAASVPQNLRAAVLILAKHYYDGGREFVDVAQAVKEIPMGARHMMESRRVEGWVS